MPEEQQEHHSCRPVYVETTHGAGTSACQQSGGAQNPTHQWRPSWQSDLCLPLSKANSQLPFHNEAESESNANWVLKWGAKPHITTQMCPSSNNNNNNNKTVIPRSKYFKPMGGGNTNVKVRERKTAIMNVKAAVINLLELTTSNLPKTMSQEEESQRRKIQKESVKLQSAGNAKRRK